jgi:CHASE2 domain-containing sensor protein
VDQLRLRRPRDRGLGRLGRRSRVAAWLLLALCLALELSAGEALFAGLRRALFDAYARAAPRTRGVGAVVIVAVDDASLRELGQWPWPRQRLAQLVKGILAGRPLAVGVDVLWPEPDRLSPRLWSEELDPLPEGLGEALRALPDHDEKLVVALE